MGAGNPGTIATQRLLLRPLATADAPRVRARCADLAVGRWLARVPHPYSDGEAGRFTAACLDPGAHDTGAHVWAIERLDEPGLVGVIGIEGEPVREVLGCRVGQPFWGQGYASEAAQAVVVGIEGEPVREVLGYRIGQPFWGQGYASEAAQAVVGWPFGALGLDRVRSGVLEGNVASLRLQENLGFRMTGHRMVGSLSLGIDVPHIDPALDRASWEATA